MIYDDKKKRKINRLQKVTQGGLVALLQIIDDFENQMDLLAEMIDKKNPHLEEIIEKMKGKDGEDADPVDPIDVANHLKNNQMFIDLIIEKIQGDKYHLTEEDIQNIATIAQFGIEPPEPIIIEKYNTNTVREVPIVNSFNHTTEITKEVALYEAAEAIRDKLEMLPEGQRLSADFIDDLEDVFRKLFKKYYNGSGITAGGGGSGGGASTGGRVVKYYDLSDQLNGVLKTFGLPANWRVISVQSSSFPNILRPIIDYTATAQSITFTSEINAASTLATGQTLIVLYSE